MFVQLVMADITTKPTVHYDNNNISYAMYIHILIPHYQTVMISTSLTVC